MPYKAKRKRQIFFHTAILLFLALLLAALIGLYFLWRSLESYEKTTPRSALLPIAAALGQRDADSLIALCGVDESRFYDRAQYAGWIEEQFGEPEGALTIQESGAAGARTGETAWEIVNENGKRLLFFLRPKEGGGYEVRQPEAPVRSYTVYAPAHVTVEVGGQPLGGAARQKDAPPVVAFAMLPEELRPAMVCYRAEGFTQEPKFTLKDRAPGGYRLEKQEDGSFTFTTRPDAETTAAVRELAERTARQYALFISTDITFLELSPLLVPDTDFYKTLQVFRNEWYIEHSPPVFEKMKSADVVEYSPDHFTVEVSFDFRVVSNKNTTQVIPSHYRMAFYRDAKTDGLLLVNLELL